MQRVLVIAMGIGLLAGAGSPADAAVDAQAVCTEKKAKAAGKKAADILKAHGRNQKKPNPARLALDLSKAQSRFTTAFTKAEARDGCATVGDAGPIGAKVDAFVADVLSEIEQPCGNGSPDGGEQCDDGAANGTPDSCCTLNCQFAPASTPCTDTDGDLCSTVAGCDGQGTCEQDSTVVCDAPDPPCEGGQTCNPGTGLCEDQPDAPLGTACDADGDSCTSDHCDGVGSCVVYDNDCCASGADLLSFETSIGSGSCGRVESRRCSNNLSSACVDDGDCDFGMCITTPPLNLCSDNPSAACTQDADCTGTCEDQGVLADLACGGLYFGGGQNYVPSPRRLPDRAKAFVKVIGCNGATGELTLGPTSAAEVGERLCSEGRKCSSAGTACGVDADCPATETCADRCFLGPPLPFPDVSLIPTSVCVVNVLAQDASGNAQCAGGGMHLMFPLRSRIHLTGDLLSSATPPDVPGLQPCPLCSRVCVGGANAGFPCTENSDCDSDDCSGSEQCLGGPNDGLGCAPATSGAELDGHTCCAGGGNNAESCAVDSDCPGGTCASDCTAFPTSHDCPPDPDLSLYFGGLPVVTFGLTNTPVTAEAVDHDRSRRTFCGFCRDLSIEESYCFEGDPDLRCVGGDNGGFWCAANSDCDSDICERDNFCPDSATNPNCRPASGVVSGCGTATPCNDDSDCSAPYESCAQLSPGALQFGAATRVTVNGSTDGSCLGDGAPHATDLVSFFCVPPFFDPVVDVAADLPGPGAATLPATVILSSGGAFRDVTGGVVD
jgi:hypothetical protein